MNVVPCVAWVKRGVAAAVPDKVQLTPKELEAIIKQTESELRDLEESDSENEDETPSKNNIQTIEEANESKTNADGMTVDEYNFGNYDNEAGDVHCNIGGLAVYNGDGKDPFVTVADSEDEDSEKEDDVIKPDDNLVLIGHVEGDASILEIFVYNEKEGSFYCHHDILLPSFPLCLEWLNFDPSDAKPGNLCAMGNMTKVIDVWDLDLVDCLEPAFRLGRKKSDKGHKDAVLDIAWNTNYTHVLASGSVDKSTMLWDMETQKRGTKLNSFTDRVQSIQFHPTEAHHLLTGCADSVVRLFDCKVENESKNWTVSGEVERVLWNHFDPNYCFVSTSNGFVECIDIRQETILWQVSAHEKEITGLSLSTSCPGLLLTASADGVVKVWDVIKPEVLEPVWEKKMNLGDIQCLAQSPDSPFIFAVGGDNKANNFKVWDLLESPSVSERFKGRNLINCVKESKPEQTDVMEVADDMDGMALEASTSSKIKKKGKK
ncbi:periodic tryptophan protein 1 homolog [Venturia canescens]|uniref:periodic tryptophan protein 1 homolog n=1 Tax=Venturia canescens TaxID=32260 RepID=UPI001C9CD946|nr:periodic tryptophan protein 1 homolog [Venturia canescens]